MYQLVRTILVDFLRGNVQAIFFHFLVELTRVFAGTFLKNKHGVADTRADL